MRGSKKDNRKRKNDDEEDSENDHDDDKSDNSDVDNTDNSPKSIPVGKLPDRLKSKKIVINISDTQYPIVEEIAEELGWVIQRK